MRKSLSRTIRFEVLKRDKFTCQYCGESAPTIVLHIDHINPVSKGGDNDLTNLITSCISCNLGKSDKLLSDDTAVKKAKNQLDELQERREQIEMMMEWQRGLRSLVDETVAELCSYWQDLAPGFIVNENGKNDIKKWTREYSISEITSAMDKAAQHYLEFEDNGSVTGESWSDGFSKILGIMRVTRESRENPELHDLYYIRGILRNRINNFRNGPGFQYLKNAHSWGVSIETLRSIAFQTRSWGSFVEKIESAISGTEEWMKQHPDDRK
jgi:hypothetical protein